MASKMPLSPDHVKCIDTATAYAWPRVGSDGNNTDNIQAESTEQAATVMTCMSLLIMIEKCIMHPDKSPSFTTRQSSLK